MAHPFRSLTSYELASAAPQAISGEKSRRVQVITSELRSEDRAFLNKILGAVDLTEKDFTLIEFTSGARFRLTDHLSMKDKILIFFDITPDAAGLSLQAQPFQVVKGYSFSCLFCSDIREIANSQQTKRQLWEALKTLFSKT